MVLQVVIGPATVGGIQAGAFKIGDTAGTIDNIIACKLYRPGSVGFVSKSVCTCYSLLISHWNAYYGISYKLYLLWYKKCCLFNCVFIASQQYVKIAST